jgi:molybdate transport system permease protein
MTAGPASVAVARPAQKKGHVSGDVVRPNLVVGAGGMIMALFLILPLVALILDAVQSDVFIASLTSPFALDALRLSIITTTTALILSLVFGTPLAVLLARGKFRGRKTLDTLCDLPMTLPPVVGGLALLLTFGRNGMLGPALEYFGISLPFTTAAVVVAATFVAAPFYVRSAKAGILAVPKEVEEAARVDGCDEFHVFRSITAPAAGEALLGGAILCGARALGEFGATIMFAGSIQGVTQTLPLAIYAALGIDVNASISMSILLLAISFVLLVAFRHWVSDRTAQG